MLTANGNPVSFVDPFGMSAERAGISQEDYEKFLLTLENIFAISKKQESPGFVVNIGLMSYYQRYDFTPGYGSYNIDMLIDRQIEISQSFDFSKGTFEKKTNSEILLGIEYSVDIDEYNSVSASMTINYDKTISAEYQISSNYSDGHSISTTMGVKTRKSDNSHKPPLITVPHSTVETEVNHSFWDKIGNSLKNTWDGLVTVGEEMEDFAEEHPALTAILVIGSLLIPGPQFGLL